MPRDLSWLDDIGPEDYLDAVEIESIPQPPMPCTFCGYQGYFGWHLEFDSGSPFEPKPRCSLAMTALHAVKPEFYHQAIALYAARYGLAGRKYWIRFGAVMIPIPQEEWERPTRQGADGFWKSELKQRGWLLEE